MNKQLGFHNLYLKSLMAAEKKRVYVPSGAREEGKFAKLPADVMREVVKLNGVVEIKANNLLSLNSFTRGVWTPKMEAWLGSNRYWRATTMEELAVCVRPTAMRVATDFHITDDVKLPDMSRAESFEVKVVKRIAATIEANRNSLESFSMPVFHAIEDEADYDRDTRRLRRWKEEHNTLRTIADALTHLPLLRYMPEELSGWCRTIESRRITRFKCDDDNGPRRIDRLCAIREVQPFLTHIEVVPEVLIAIADATDTAARNLATVTDCSLKLIVESNDALNLSPIFARMPRLVRLTVESSNLRASQALARWSSTTVTSLTLKPMEYDMPWPTFEFPAVTHLEVVSRRQQIEAVMRFVPQLVSLTINSNLEVDLSDQVHGYATTAGPFTSLKTLRVVGIRDVSDWDASIVTPGREDPIVNDMILFPVLETFIVSTQDPRQEVTFTRITRPGLRIIREF